MSSISTTVRLDPETANRCSRSVALKAAWRSSGTLEVSPTTSPGSRALASAGSPSVASRSPARRCPAIRWTAVGPPVTRGGVSAPGRSRATARSLPRAGASAATTSTRVEGWSRAHPGCPARTRTGVSTRVRAPSGPVTRVTTASSTTTGGPPPPPALRGSEPTVSSARTRACFPASPTTGPARASARSSPATAAPAPAQSRTAATAAPARHAGRVRRRPTTSAVPAATTARPAPAAVHPTGAPRARAVAPQAATAGPASRRSTGPSSACPDARAATSGPLTAAPAHAGRRTCAPRSR